MEEVDVTARVVRAGHTIELVEAVLAHGDRPAVVLRAWLPVLHDEQGPIGTLAQTLTVRPV